MSGCKAAPRATRHRHTTHVSLANAHLHLAELRVRQNRTDEAALRLQSAEAQYQALYDADDWHWAEVQRVRGALLAADGQYAEAESLLLSSHATLTQRWGTESKYTRRAASDLYALYTTWDRPDQAAAYAPQ